MTKSASIQRVLEAAKAKGHPVSITTFSVPVKTAQAAANEIGCEVGQIANSLIFEGHSSGKLYLLLTSGRHRVDIDYAAGQIGEALDRADVNRVRQETGFAVGGVAPIGHLSPIESFIDRALFDYDVVWAAGGRAETVFDITPQALAELADAQQFNAVKE